MANRQTSRVTGQNPKDPLVSVTPTQLNRGANIPKEQMQDLQKQQEATGIGNRIAGGIRWVTSWVSHPIAAASVLINYMTKERKYSLDEVASAGLVYIPSERIEAILQQPGAPEITKTTAREVIAAGQAAYIQAENVLKSFLLYKNAYEKEGSATSNPIVLLVMTRRLFEDILIYLVLNYRKNMLRLKLQTLVREPIGQSQPYRSLSGSPLPLFPQELLDNLREIILANKALAKEYGFEVSAGIREHAELPYIEGTLSPDENITTQQYYELMLPAIELYEKILQQRREVFGTEDQRISHEEMKKRLTESHGSTVAGVPSEVLTDIDDVRSTVAEYSRSAPSSLNALSFVWNSRNQQNANANANANARASSIENEQAAALFLTQLAQEEQRGVKRGRNNNQNNSGSAAKRPAIGGRGKGKRKTKSIRKHRSKKHTQRKRR